MAALLKLDSLDDSSVELYLWHGWKQNKMQQRIRIDHIWSQRKRSNDIQNIHEHIDFQSISVCYADMSNINRLTRNKRETDRNRMNVFFSKFLHFNWSNLCGDILSILTGDGKNLREKNKTQNSFVSICTARQMMRRRNGGWRCGWHDKKLGWHFETMGLCRWCGIAIP